MQLEKVTLLHFRNYTREEISFSPGLNCIQGDNAEGKSNLLEAIHLLSTGKSFRTHRLSDLIKDSKQEFQIQATFLKDEISNSLTISFGPEGRKALYNNTSYSSFLPLLGLLPCVLLAPEDISIITGSPAERRRFLDLHLSQIDPLYLHHLGRFHKAMKQRNTLLKKQDQKELFPWEQIMSLSAHYIAQKRIDAIISLEKQITKIISLLSGAREIFSWNYENSLKTLTTSPELYLQKWRETRLKELLLGTTLIGPHRDDISFYLQGKEMKTHSSEGQKRSCIAALRLAEWERFKHLLQYPPLLGVDDFGVHLDEKRTLLLREALSSLGQVFLTAPSFSLSTQKIHYLQVINGTVTSQDALNKKLLMETV